MSEPLVALGSAALLGLGLALLFWPKRGLWQRWRRARQMSSRVLTEDALKHIHKCEMKGRRPTVDSLAGAVQIGRDDAARVLTTLQEMGLLTIDQGDFHLTPAGREAALHIIRAHRLWERYLADETGYDEAEWHEQAERLEHTLPPAEVDALAAQLGHPTHDPHGDPIPDAAGQFVAHGGQPLTALAVDVPGQIVHIEDEPEVVYAQLVAEGLYPGMAVRLVESSPQRVRFWANGDEHLLAPLLAANISVVPGRPERAELPTSPESWQLSEPGGDLSMLKPGQQAEVVAISPRCRGPERRRLMDLGILPGTLVTAEMVSPSGDPTAYRIRDALIALRSDQARLINVTSKQSTA
jgi:DtxR family Mn-dependent transcriptional regulator